MSLAIPTPQRRLEIEVVGTNNLPVEGADIDFSVQTEGALERTLLGGVSNSLGKASILIKFDFSDVKVVASFAGISETVILPPTVIRATVSLKISGGIAPLIPTSTSVCADGKSGQPCVDCNLKGKPYQICA
jgi:hypothetical protein